MLGDDTTEQRLRLLHAEFTQHTRTGPPGDGRSSRPVVAPAPLDLDVIDYMAAAATEVEQHTRAAEWSRPAGPVPADVTRVYDWARDHTADHAPEQQAVLEAIIYRQGLELALRMGDTTVIRKHPCPQCRCWGLVWSPAAQKATCVNQYCVDSGEISRTWSLARLAQQHIARQETSRTRAT